MSLERPTRSIHLLEFGSSHSMRKQRFSPTKRPQRRRTLFSQAIRLMKSWQLGYLVKKTCDYLALFFKMKVLKTVFRERFSRIFLRIAKNKKKLKQSRFCCGNGEFKITRWRRQRELQKTNTFNKQNNNFARTSYFFVHFLAVVARLQRESA